MRALANDARVTSARANAEAATHAATAPEAVAPRGLGAGAGAVAVILAAGEGSRLGRPSKPLASVAGLTLLERTVATVRAAGVSRVIVVVGHAKESVARFVAERRLDVELVENDRFSLGSGSSAAVGGLVAGDRFVLMMCDHLVEPEAVARMIACREPFAVAVDTQPAYGETHEATKVRIANGAVVAVGRDLDRWDAVDAGIFVCDRSVVETAEHVLAAGDATWNDVKRRWIAEGRRLEAVDLTGAFWIDVDTPDDVRRAERLILERATVKPFDGIVSRKLNRRVSPRISLLLVRAGASPTATTLGTFAFTLVAAGVLALGSRSALALAAGGVLVQLASIFDGCDGEVARATLRSSRFGALLDTLLDRVSDAALLTALAVAAGFATGTWAALTVAVFFALFVPYVKAAYEASARRSFPPLRLSFGRDARMLTIAVAAVALQPLWALVAVAVVSGGEAVVRSVVALRAVARVP